MVVPLFMGPAMLFPSSTSILPDQVGGVCPSLRVNTKSHSQWAYSVEPPLRQPCIASRLCPKISKTGEVRLFVFLRYEKLNMVLEDGMTIADQGGHKL